MTDIAHPSQPNPTMTNASLRQELKNWCFCHQIVVRRQTLSGVLGNAAKFCAVQNNTIAVCESRCNLRISNASAPFSKAPVIDEQSSCAAL